MLAHERAGDLAGARGFETLEIWVAQKPTRRDSRAMLTNEELVAAVFDDPRADEPRLIYADWLLERGDPRGEFINLQFARHGGQRADKKGPGERELELLSSHREAWIGTLRCITPVEFRRGFVAKARLSGFDLDLENPEWSTIEELWIEWADAAPDKATSLFRFLATRGLSVAAGLNAQVLANLLLGPPADAIVRLHVTALSAEENCRFHRLIEKAADGGGLPNLAHLEIAGSVRFVNPLLVTPLGDAIRAGTKLDQPFNRSSAFSW